MSKHFHILNWMPLIYAVMFITIWVVIYENETIAFEEFVLEKQCNYASDSAIDAMLTQSNLGLDYSDNQYLSLNPQVGKDDFVETMCMNFGYLVNDETRLRVETKNIRALVIATYDGVYSYTLMNEDNIGSKTLVQSPKIPYLYTDANGCQYTLTLDSTVGYADSGEPDNNYAIHKLGKYELMQDVVAPTDDVQKTVISNLVSEILNWCLYESLSDGRDETVELPAVAGAISGGQSIDKPTIIGVVESANKVFTTHVIAGGIGGAQITDNTDIIGCDLNDFEINGVPYTGKYYATSDWWDRHFSSAGTKVNERYFDNVFEAAKEGYVNLTLLY